MTLRTVSREAGSRKERVKRATTTRNDAQWSPLTFTSASHICCNLPSTRNSPFHSVHSLDFRSPDVVVGRQVLLRFYLGFAPLPPLINGAEGYCIRVCPSVSEWVCASWKTCERHISKTNERTFFQWCSQGLGAIAPCRTGQRKNCCCISSLCCWI